MTRFSLILLAAGALGCSSELDNKPKAEVAPVTDAAKPDAAKADAPKADAPAAGGDKIYMADASRGKIEFVGAKITGDHTGGFNTFETKLTVNEAGAPTAIETTIDMASMVSDKEKLTGHLKSPDFFDVEQFTTATFKSSRVALGGETSSHTVTGTLDMHGVQKEISFPATITMEEGKANLKAEFLIQRFDWKIEYPGKPDDLIKNDVLIKLDLNYS